MTIVPHQGLDARTAAPSFQNCRTVETVVCLTWQLDIQIDKAQAADGSSTDHLEVLKTVQPKLSFQNTGSQTYGKTWFRDNKAANQINRSNMFGKRLLQRHTFNFGL